MTAERLERELGPEQPMFIEGCQAEWDELPRPDLPLTVGLDGGCFHSSQQRSRRDGWFEVIAGKSMPTDGPASASALFRPTTTNRNVICSTCSGHQEYSRTSR